MDRLQFSVVQNATRAVAAEAVASIQTEVLRHLLSLVPTEAKSQLLMEIAQKLDLAKIHYQAVAIQGQPPEYSDLIAGEFQEAFERLSEDVKTKLRDGKI